MGVFHRPTVPEAPPGLFVNKTKQNKTKQNKTKQNKTKQNKTKQNKTKQNKTKQDTFPLNCDPCSSTTKKGKKMQRCGGCRNIHHFSTCLHPCGEYEDGTVVLWADANSDEVRVCVSLSVSLALSLSLSHSHSLNR